MGRWPGPGPGPVHVIDVLHQAQGLRLSEIKWDLNSDWQKRESYRTDPPSTAQADSLLVHAGYYPLAWPVN
jgi:hypothetical protein